MTGVFGEDEALLTDVPNTQMYGGNHVKGISTSQVW